MIVDLEMVANAITEIAQEEIAARFGKLLAGDISTKSGPNDYVTNADVSAEKRLAKMLSGVYPGATFIGEEIASRNPELISRLGRDGAYWIVDPLDGTRNFVQGRNAYGTMVALVVNGEIRNGWIYAIPTQTMAMGAAGEGAVLNGEPVSPAATAPSSLTGFRAIGSLTEPWKTRLTPRLRERFVTEAVHCSAYGYIDLLRGERQFALYSRCWPWDHAAGVMLLREIGGRAEYLDDGQTYYPLATYGRPLLIAANSAAHWDQLLEGLCQ